MLPAPQSVSGRCVGGKEGFLAAEEGEAGRATPPGWAGAPAQETRHCQGRVRGLPVWSMRVRVGEREDALSARAPVSARLEDIFLTFH